MEEVAYLLLAIASTLAALYVLHLSLAPRGSPAEGKEAPYACGEDLPPGKFPFTVVFFKYVCLFTVTDVVAMLLAFAFTPMPAAERNALRLAVLTYCLTLSIALLATVGRSGEVAG